MKRLSLLPFLLLCACTEPIVMDPLEEMPVVVNCVLKRERQGSGTSNAITEQKLWLYYAKSSAGEGYVAVEDADVTVSGGGFSYKFKWNGNCWTSLFLPEFDTEYTLNVTLPKGRTLSGRTVYPEALFVSDCSMYVYPSRMVSLVGWKRITKFDWHSGPDRDAYLWITPRSEDVSIFVSDHSGSDNTNVIPGSWMDLTVFSQCCSNIAKIRQDYKFIEFDYGIWNAFVQRCNTIPLHKGYLRIHHPANYKNGNNDAKKQSYYYTDKAEVDTDYLDDAFILYCDYAAYANPYTLGAADYVMPCDIHFLSKEYDAYLNSIVRVQLRKDELVGKFFSPDANYTNIVGGLGVFGALY